MRCKGILPSAEGGWEDGKRGNGTKCVRALFVPVSSSSSSISCFFLSVANTHHDGQKDINLFV
jgi:hypothetical protein